MKQILQSLQSGVTDLVESPSPRASAKHLLIQTRRSLISAGTERMLASFGRAGWLEKARQQPDKVRMVLDKVRTDGLLTTADAVRFKLAQPLRPGYCSAGVVVEVGDGVTGFCIGDRVISNGNHAELVRVPRNLCARIPAGVDDESAAFTVLAAIGLQGIRLAKPTLGECFVVTGVGLIGLATVQLLRAHGCRVLAVDFDAGKLAIAERFGATICNLSKGEDPLVAGWDFSEGRGVDGIIITASTQSSDPVSQAARMSRQHGRIVLVGVTGLELDRSDFYEKELSFQVSCSYGPGRYDQEYEDKGHDYPLGFVRWTEQRNFEAVLQLMAEGRLDVQPLVSHRFAFEDAPKAYELLTTDKSALGIVLEYPEMESDVLQRREVRLRGNADPGRFGSPAEPIVSFIGAGNYASRVLIPAFKAGGARLQALVSASGVNSVVHGGKAGFAVASTDVDSMLRDGTTNAVVVATQHNSHARFVEQAIQAGKHVFVEKPLCLTLNELERIQAVLNGSEADEGGNQRTALLMVGFNRRFAPHVRQIKSLLERVKGPKAFVMTVNAGEIPANHWTQDTERGGGRVIGEACHFIDLLRFLADAPITAASGNFADIATYDTASLQFGFGDGSIGTVPYFANGSKMFPKERLEVFASDRILQLDNFRKLRAFGWPGVRPMRLWRQDKGQQACAAAFLKAVRDGAPSPIPLDQILEVSRISIELAQSR